MTEMNNLEIKTLDVPGASNPEPHNHSIESASLLSAVDACIAGKPSSLYWKEASQSATPWVAFQLGCAAEYNASHDDLELALGLALYAVGAAEVLKDTSRLRSNFVTLGNVLLRQQEINEALHVFKKVVESEPEKTSFQTIAALMGIANCLTFLQRPHEAAVSFEKSYLSIRNELDPHWRKQLAARFARICDQADDIGGVFFAVCDFDRVEAEEILFEQAIPKMSFDQAVSTHTRLMGLSMFTDAQSLRQHWLKHNKQGKLK